MVHRVEGFDTEPDDLDAFEKTQPNAEGDRRVARTDRRLYALKSHVENLLGQTQRLNKLIPTLATKEDLERNTKLTEEMLRILNGGKFLVALLKFAASIALAVTAIMAALHLFNGGTPPPPH